LRILLLAALVAPALPARATTIAYELVILLQPGSVLLDSAGGPSFDDAAFSPAASVAADAFDFEFTFTPGFYTFSIAGCSSLTGHVDGAGTAVTALSGTCAADGGASLASITFNSDNTAFVDIPQLVLGLNATYSLIPEPGAALLFACTAALAWCLRGRS